jgi:hypothetical protein
VALRVALTLCLSQHDRMLGLWMARSDVTVVRCALRGQSRVRMKVERVLEWNQS